jgi:Abortive infection alpha
MPNDDGDDLKAIVRAGGEVISEVAKAEQEQQRTYQIGLDLVRRAGTFLGGVFGPASQELGQMFSDQMKFWRFKNAVRILEKAQSIANERGLKPEQIRAMGFGEGVLLLEAASMEEHETVQDLWARLMANAVDPKSSIRVEKIYIDVLKSLSSREVVFLELLERIEQERGAGLTINTVQEFRTKMSFVAEGKWRRFPTEERAMSIQNLMRLRCVTVSDSPIDTFNLFEQVSEDGLGRWSFVDGRKLERLLNDMSNHQRAASGATDFEVEDVRSGVQNEPRLPEGDFALTPLGRGLLKACKEQAPNGAVEEPA